MRLPAVFMILLVCGASACSRSKVADYYVLTAHAFDTAGGAGGPAIGIRPVLLPKYVDRDNIVTMAGPQRLLLDEQHLWAEPLDENVTRVLAESLSVLLATERIHLHRWPQGAVDYEISVHVVRMTGTLGGEAGLQAFWTVRAGDGREPLVSRRTDLRRPAGVDHAAYAAALGDMLAELSRQIAGTIPRASGARR